MGAADETFGFLSIGAVAEFPLWNNAFGDAALTAGVNVFILGDTTEAANNGDDIAVTASLGISVSF